MNNQKIKFAFFGSDLLSITVLEKLKELGFLPNLLITTKDKPKGRGLILTPSPAKTWAIKNKIEHIEPETLKEIPEKLLEEKYDIFIVASYGLIIPKKILEIPLNGTLNVHPSLLPKYRGPSPVQTVILNKDKKTGVSVILLDEKMDHGPIVSQKEFDTKKDEDFTSLLTRSGEMGAQMLVEIFLNLKESIASAKSQDDSSATFTKMIKKEDGLIDINDPEIAYQKFLAFSEWPGVYFFIEDKGRKIRIKVTEAELDNGNFIPKKIIPEGKKETSWEIFKKNSNT